MDSGGVSGAPTSDDSPHNLAEPKAAKQAAAAAQSERDQARRALGQGTARRARGANAAQSERAFERCIAANRGCVKKRAKKGMGKGTC